MHAENASIAFRRLSDRACGVPPFGRSDLHACIADWNAGPLTLTPLTCVLPLIAWTFSTPPPFVVGSGKLRTPCERMHDANSSDLL